TKLASAGHSLEEQTVKLLDVLGLTEGSTLDGALKVDEQGIEECYRVKTADPKGLLSILAHLPPAAPLAGGAPAAMDLLPPHTALWFSLRAEVAAQAEPLAQALRALDKLATMVPPT